MRKYLLQIGFYVLSLSAIGQTNTFPSSGNVGIGNTSPSYLLDVNGTFRTQGTLSRFDNSINLGGSGSFSIDAPGISNGRLFMPANGNLNIGYASDQGYKLAINGSASFAGSISGNTGIINGNLYSSSFSVGANSYSNWNGIPAIEITNIANAAQAYFGGTTNGAYVGANNYWNGNNWVYKTSAGASQLMVAQGGYYFSIAQSGTAGNNISWNNIMSLTNSSVNINAPLNETSNATFLGTLGVGTTTPNSNFVVTNPSNTQGLEINQLYSGFSRIFSYNRTANTPIPLVLQDVGSYLMVGTTTNHSNEILQVGGTFYTSGTATFNSQVIIGTPVQSNPNYLLNVTGNIRANKLVVNTTGADFVFAKKYHLTPLGELEKYIQQNKHLPGIEPAKEMTKDGVDVGNNETKLLQKIEELTLYMIEMKKANEQLENKVEVLNKRITEIGNDKKK